MLHELDHVYQLQEEARKNNRPYLKASEVKVRLARGHTTTNVPFPIVNILFDTVIKKDSFQIEDAVTVALNKRYHQTTILIGNSETMVKSVEANYTKCGTIISLVAAWNHLTEAEKRELFESGISKYENEEMEVAAYQREIQRSERFPQLYLNEKQIEELKSNAVENYLRFHLTKNLPQICNYSWVKEVPLKTLPHVYLESREEK